MHFATRILPKLATAACVTAFALCLGLAGCATPADTASTITVSGTSTVKVVPDVARISVTITTQGANPSQAQKANGAPTTAVIDKLKELGVPAENIQTTYTDLSPIWDENGKTDTYEMRTMLSVDGLAIADVSSIMDACVDAGATEVNGPEYYVSSYDDAYAEALSAAVEATRPKAEAIAQASGVSLGKVLDVSEGYQDTTLAYAASNDMAVEEALDTGGGMADIEPGQVTVRAEVTVSYAIN